MASPWPAFAALRSHGSAAGHHPDPVGAQPARHRPHEAGLADAAGPLTMTTPGRPSGMPRNTATFESSSSSRPASVSLMSRTVGPGSERPARWRLAQPTAVLADQYIVLGGGDFRDQLAGIPRCGRGTTAVLW